ncbi:MAG: hypothetical protein U1E54_00505, partial [Candidatus Levybacteria bacterium]|nr:hypothetical protein [Candidatus Levybacteria bacterium]
MEFYYVPIDQDITILDLVEDTSSLFYGFKNKSAELLAYKDEQGKTNRERIIEVSGDAEWDSATSTIKAGTMLVLPKSSLLVSLIPLVGKNLFIKNIKSFATYYGAYLELLNKEGFSPRYRTTNESSDIDIRQYNISVWVWSRSYSRNGTTLLDVSNYIENCSTIVNGSNNSFSISLQAVDEKSMKVGDEEIDRINIDKNDTKGSYYDFVEPTTNTAERLPIPWFKKILQQNDIFFIRFEQLECESTSDRVGSGKDISASNLPGKTFDMIGLVDRVNSRFNTNTNDMVVDVIGRDLTKLLVEDGCYFFPLLFTENSETLFFNTQDDSKWFKRTFVKNTFDYLFAYKMQSIRDSLGFLVNQLANIGVCNDELFSSYDDKGEGTPLDGAGQGGRRTKTLMITGVKQDTLRWNNVSGVWQIIDILVDTQLDDRRIANSLVMNPSGTLQSVVDSFCQRPFVEFYGDTYGDKFTFVARTPPYTKEAILSILNSGSYIDVNLRDVEEVDLNWDPTFYTWFQMDPRNMFLGKTESIALAYLPVVYFPEIAETFGNKQMMITDNYLSNAAMTGEGVVEDRDLFKRKVIEDYLYVIESYCYLPFTEMGTITLKRDRRIKAKTWVKIGAQLFYVESLSNSFHSVNEKIGGETTLSVIRGMYIEYIRGTMVEELSREIDYWSMIKLDVIRKALIQKMIFYGTEEEATKAGASGTKLEAKIAKNTVKVSFGTDREAFD